MSITIDEVKKKEQRLRIRSIRKNIFEHSPTTIETIQYGLKIFGKIGAYYGVQTLANMSFIATPTKITFGKFGESGIGKTLPETVARKVLKKARKELDLSGSKGITPAGLSKLYRKTIGDKATSEDLQNWNKIVNSDFVYIEDFAMLRTKYVRETTAIVVHRLPYNTDMSDLTSSGEATVQVSLGEQKRVMFSGTPDVYDEITSLLTYDEFMNRRCLYLTVWLSPREWQEREKLALSEFYTNSDRELHIAKDWITTIENGLKLGKENQIMISEDEDELKRIKRERKKIYDELIKFKRIPESALEKIDAMAMGHAIINGRSEVLAEDYEFISLLLWKFVVTAVMRHKELSIFNEVCRKNGKGVTVREVADYLRIKSRRLEIPSLSMSIREIRTHVELSRFMFEAVDNETREITIYFTDEAKKLIKLWDRVIRRIERLA